MESRRGLPHRSPGDYGAPGVPYRLDDNPDEFWNSYEVERNRELQRENAGGQQAGVLGLADPSTHDKRKKQQEYQRVSLLFNVPYLDHT